VRTIRMAATADIDAPADVVYAILADYRTGHPGILPRKYFIDYDVEKGGSGAGTRIRFSIRLLGKVRTVRAEITEPQPGRVLAEEDVDTGAMTTFTVDPVEGARRSRVTIETVWSTPGLSGLLESWFAPRLLRRIYVEELANLDRAALKSYGRPS